MSVIDKFGSVVYISIDTTNRSSVYGTLVLKCNC